MKSHEWVANGCLCHVACINCEATCSREYARTVGNEACNGSTYHPSGAHKVDTARRDGIVFIAGHVFDYDPLVDLQTYE